MDIELPKDAEGREISLDTEVLYQKDGKERQVLKWEFYPRDSVPMWIACLEHNNSYDYRNSKFLYLTPTRQLGTAASGRTWPIQAHDLSRYCNAHSQAKE